MATAFSHALVGSSLVGLSPLGPSRRRLALLLGAVAVLPDVDVVGFRLGIPYDHPLGHRGFTHSLCFAALVGVVSVGVFFRDLRPLTTRWWAVASVVALATASHGMLDALTDAGLGIGFFIPFAEERFFAPWRPLATSPLSVQAFFSGPALGILANEVFWVWLPLGAFLLLGRVSSRVCQRGSA